MPVSIKRSSDSEDGARQFPGITSGKDYPVQGFSGGGLVVVNDDGKFLHVGFADVDADWTVTVEGAAKKADDKKTAPVSTSAPDEMKTTT